MTVISRNSEVCTSSPVLEFLGVDLLSDQNYFAKRRECINKPVEVVQNRGSYEMEGDEDIFIKDEENSMTKSQKVDSDIHSDFNKGDMNIA